MKHILLIVFSLLFTQALQAEEMKTEAYAGIGASHVDGAEESTVSQMIYGGWAVGYTDRPDSLRTEFQLEQYSDDPIDVLQFSLHIMGAIMNTNRHQAYIDLGMNGAQFEAFGTTENEGFFSYGLGYRYKLGNASIRVSYTYEDIDRIAGVDIENPKKANIGADWKF
jgi:hypothetical protein